MLKNLCKICSSRIVCNYCVTYGKTIGQNIYKKNELCKICYEDGKCEFCVKYGEKKGKILYKNYIEYVKSF